MVIRIVVDDRAGPRLMVDQGFSAWIRVGRQSILFDTAHRAALAGNAAALRIDLASLDALVLSHGHHDHTDGVPLVLERGREVEVYCHPGAIAARYSIRCGHARSISMPVASRAALDRAESLGRLRWVIRPMEVGPGVGLAPCAPRRTPYEDAGGPLFLDASGRTPDPVEDDLALWVRTADGLVVVVGCCHAGLVNTLRHVQASSGESRIRAVLGGFHMREASEERLFQTLEELRQLNPELIVPCHCTGDRATELLAQALGERVVRGGAGARFHFPPPRGAAGRP